ncbi:MAG: hypothetical protein AB7E51_13225 [Pseudodesulfovibrio sp.]|jgi:hypothetical protein|uniref:PBS lyase n=1 Tax=Pseudodesulfovibrio indicus TaxID=1716143 RepID=A0A126QLV9_9BACT|nr:hypothetical protein [Pseudodesulfovibrio indicus]AMK10827.1 hypothetical protein AWY79_06765 [Pseudodesulfovibrio indicus]TDT91820.1 hypothetical protein EDC59_101222 [Pseudodesulfovibrio indicus]
MSKHCSLHTLAFLLAVCLSFQALPAGAQDESLSSLAARARECGVCSETLDRVLDSAGESQVTEPEGASLIRPLIEACDLRLPLNPFCEKLEEGLSKHVRPPLIVRALQLKIEDYVFARSLLPGPQEEINPRLLTILGEGLSKGTPRADVEAYVGEFSSQPPEPFLAGAEMVCLLGQVRFDYGLTRTMLEAGFKSGGLDGEWRFFIWTVLVARQRGITDPQIAHEAVLVLADKGAPSDVSSRLGFSSRNLSGRSSVK